MSDAVVMIMTSLLALGVPVLTVWGTWRIARHRPTRQRALAIVIGSIAGTTLLGVVLPAALLGAFDPFPIWLVYAALSAAGASVLAWRWPALRSGNWNSASLMLSSFLLLVVLATSSIAVT